MKKQPTSRTCFLCGRENDHGLKLEWFDNYEEKRVECTVTFPEYFNGYPGIVHGGIIAAVLDESAGRAIMLDGNIDNLFVTLNLNITYKTVTPTETPLKVFSWIIREGGKSAKVAARLMKSDGTVTAECEAIVVRPPKAIQETWEPERKHWHS
ncbi:PaaI family thioesterase [candidate division KSB1 bacterium]|nr:PaaI family thioesterase [candidate division KSB1 bacterium]